ncbi:glycosyltransferase [uncultured Olleya sp.]|uniref:glycosyltransferase n=1 Tax=uncultured Olleya sp. TaxID=757243 RepID=UPI002596942A|nr:glycosyltransferase [uncultured Olleya sp.]
MKASNPLVSFVIPCFNDFQYVEQSVNSALHQTYRNIEVIVVDDGSNAKTKAVLKTIEPKITRLITQENKGQSTARNVGIENAKGDYIIVLDSDDYFEPTFCKKAIEIIINNTEVKLVTCFAKIFVNGKVREVYKPKGGYVKDFLITNSALGCAMFRKEDWLSCGGYDESMRRGFEDWEFNINLLKKGGFAKVIDEALFFYRKRENTTTERANKVKYKLLKYIYSKHNDVLKNYTGLVINGLILKISIEEESKIKQQKKIEFRIGKTILKPFRFFKSFFN